MFGALGWWWGGGGRGVTALLLADDEAPLLPLGWCEGVSASILPRIYKRRLSRN
jgi:hypothetical protein